MKVWTPALDADGGIREGGDVAKLTGLIDPAVLGKWPAGMRVIVRRERPHPGGAAVAVRGTRRLALPAFVTNTTTGQFAFLEARHRPRPRRGPHPTRQGLRPGPVPVAGVRHQPDLGLRSSRSRPT